MDWLAENWFWVLIFILFIVMHMFGHGGHTHGKPTDEDKSEKNEHKHH